MRSRVIPGSSPTIERRVSVSRLNRVDLPTFGRPQMATSGSRTGERCSSAMARFIAEASASASFHSRSSCRLPAPPATELSRFRRPSPSTGLSSRPERSEAERPAVDSPRLPAPSPRLPAAPRSLSVTFRSRSGLRVGVFATFSAAAFFAASSFLFFGETAPVVAVAFGAFLPSFGRVLACRCFLPNLFAVPRLGAIKSSVSSIIRV